MSSVEMRVRNRRGEGTRLRQEILEAAVEIMEATGNPEAVTLRAVARRVGISAPSIYGHFPDREAIVAAVVNEGFARLLAALHSAIDQSDDAAERLRLGCRAYLRFADEHPQVYQALFSVECAVGPDGGRTMSPEGVAAFQVLVDGVRDAVTRGGGSSTDPDLDSVALWVAMHGMSTLMSVDQAFPWPDRNVVLDRLIAGLLRLP